MLGNLLGHKISSTNLALSASIITRLIDCGMAYVSSPSDTLMATLNLRRSVLPLDAAVAPPHSAKRLRELSRVLRAAKKQGSAAISLRLNTNIELAIAKLRAHHKDDCWVGPQLEAVWKLMARTSPPQLMVFELWLGEEMIAADFTHPIWTSFGRSVYVATRFFDREAHNKLQPGFMVSAPSLLCCVAGFICHFPYISAVVFCGVLRAASSRLRSVGSRWLRPVPHHAVQTGSSGPATGAQRGAGAVQGRAGAGGCCGHVAAEVWVGADRGYRAGHAGLEQERRWRGGVVCNKTMRSSNGLV